MVLWEKWGNVKLKQQKAEVVAFVVQICRVEVMQLS